MLLVIDDERNLGGDIIARTPDGAKTVLKNIIEITDLCIDFDLGFPETGDQIIKWAAENNCLPPHVQVVSMNHPGREAIKHVLIDAGYKEKDGWWHKQQ